MLLDGATPITNHYSEPAGSSDSDQSFATLYKLEAEQYVVMDAWHDAGGNLDILAVPNLSAEFAMQLVGLPGTLDIGARAYHDANQNSSHGTWKTMELNSERWDTDGIHDNVTNNSRLTAQTAGKYIITGSIFFDDDPWNTRGIHILLNGATVIAWHHNLAAGFFGGGDGQAIGTLYHVHAAAGGQHASGLQCQKNHDDGNHQRNRLRPSICRSGIYPKCIY